MIEIAKPSSNQVGPSHGLEGRFGGHTPNSSHSNSSLNLLTPPKFRVESGLKASQPKALFVPISVANVAMDLRFAANFGNVKDFIFSA